MKNKNFRRLLLIGALVAGYIGLRFVTQAGQGLDAVQNDGYGGTGGIMLIVSGFVLGVLFATQENK